MPSDPAAPDLTAILDRIRERAAASEAGHGFLRTAHRQSAIDVLPLLAAADAVLTFHYEFEGRCVTCREHCTCIEDAYAAAGFPDKLDHFQAEAIARAWSDCTHGNMPWPCPEYLAIARALTGTETADAT